MPYQSTVLENERIVYTRLIGIFSQADIADYIQYLLNSKIYHENGRLLVDYAELDEIKPNFDELLEVTEPMARLSIKGGIIWQAGINAGDTNIGVSRQVNTLLQIQNPEIQEVKLKFFDSKDEAVNWLVSKP